MKAILERRSIRRYTDEPVSEDDMKDLLRAAMAAPSAHNEQPWEFIVIRDRQLLAEVPKFHEFSNMLNEAPAAIMICRDMTKEGPGLWVEACSAATENILIAAQDKGLGAVWLAVYPYEGRVEGARKLFSIPENVIPFNIIALGHPKSQKEPADRYDENRVHLNKW